MDTGMRKLSDYKRLPIDKTNNICEKCGQEMELITIKRNGFLTAGQVFMCKKCHKLYPIAHIKK